jgi:hypothetical protein
MTDGTYAGLDDEAILDHLRTTHENEDRPDDESCGPNGDGGSDDDDDGGLGDGGLGDGGPGDGGPDDEGPGDRGSDDEDPTNLTTMARWLRVGASQLMSRWDSAAW